MTKRLCLILLVLITIFIINGEFRAPEWQIVVYTNSTVAYCHITIDGIEAAEGDMVGAFVNGECRGISNVFVYGGSAYSVMNIQGETVETVDFQVWDASTNNICSVEESIQSYPGHDLGYPPDFIQINALPTSGIEDEPPVTSLPAEIEFTAGETYNFAILDHITDDGSALGINWQNNENINIDIAAPQWQQVNYGSFTQVYAFLEINGEPVPLDYQAGIFAGNQCRCLASLQSYNNRSFLNAVIQGTSQENLQFRVKDPATGRVWVSEDEIVSNPGGMIGYPTHLEIDCSMQNLEGYLLLSNSEDWTGSEEIIFAIDDYYNETVYDTVLVTVFEGNNAPVFTLPDTLYINEDEVLDIDFSEYFYDEDDDVLTLELITAGENIAADLLGYQVEFSALENWSGCELFGFRVTDEGGLSAEDEVDICFVPVNDAPDLSLPEEIFWQEDTDYILNLRNYIFDIENDAVEIIWENHDYINWELSEINWEPVEYEQTMNVFGLVSILGEDLALNDIVGAFVDGECRGIGNRWANTNYTSFSVYTQEVENMYFRILDVSENLIYSIDLEIETIPGGTIGYPPNVLPLAGNELLQNMTYKLTPEANWFGSTSIELSAIDSHGAQNTDDISVNITAVNDLPQEILPESLELLQGGELFYDLTPWIFDIDGDSLMVSLISCTLTAEIDNNLLHIQAQQETPGEYPLQLSISDGTESITASVIIALISNNLPPELNLPSELSFNEDEQTEFNWMQYTQDPENDELAVLWWGNQNVVISNSEPGYLLISAIADFSGEEMLYLEISDEQHSVSDSIQIIVLPVNDPPVYVGSQSIAFEEDGSYFLNADEVWQDIDSPSLIYNGTAEHITVTAVNEFLVLIPQQNWNGTTYLYMTAQDEQFEIPIEIEITVNPVNDEPWLELPLAIEFAEDTSWQTLLSDISGDIDGDSLYYSSLADDIIIDFSNNHCSITAPDNWHGTEDVTITVTDNVSRVSVSQEINVSVFAVNDPPIMELPDMVELPSGTDIELDFWEFCSDIDSENIYLSAEDTEHVTVLIEEMSVVFSAAELWQGQEIIHFTLSDEEFSIIDQLPVNVTYSGDDFDFDLPADISFPEDEQLVIELSQYIYNPLQANVSIEASEADFLITEITGTQLTILPQQDWSGEEEITFTAVNINTQETLSDVVLFTVTPVNDAPVLALPEQISINEDSSNLFNFATYCNDIDSSDLEFSLLGTYEELNIQLQGFNALISGVTNYYGQQQVYFSLSDGYLAVSDSVLIVIEPVNDPPNINLPNRFYLYEDDSLVIDMSDYIMEYDDDVLILSVDGNENVYANFDGLTVEFSAAANWFGSETITITVDDGVGRAIDSDNVEIVVLPVNDPPAVNLPQSFEIWEDSLIVIDLSIYSVDIDDENLTISAAVEDMMTELADMELTITPQPDANEPQVLCVCLSDGEYTTCDSSMINIIPVNDPPELDLPAVIYGMEDEQIILDLADYAFDIDGDELIFSAVSYGLDCSVQNNILYITPPADWFGSEDMMITAADGEFTAEGTVSIEIAPVNDPPQIDLPEDIHWLEDMTAQLDLTLYCTDIDSQYLIFTASADTIDIEISQGMAVFTSPANWAGEEEVVFTVNDLRNRSITQDTVTAVVEPVNDAPQLTLPQEFIFYENSVMEIDMNNYCSDIDSDILYLEMLSDPQFITVELADFQLLLSALDNWSGSEIIEFSLSDGDLTTTAQTQVNVIPTGDEPQLNLPAEISFAEDNVYQFNLEPYIQNIEGYELVLSYEGNDQLAITIQGQTALFDPAENWYGSELIFFYITSVDQQLTDVDSIMVNVLPVNDPPELTLPPQWNGWEDQQITVDLTPFAQDIENDPLNWSVCSSNLNWELNESELTLWMPQNEHGDGSVMITVSDWELSDSGEIAVLIAPVNDAPWIELPQQVSFAEDTFYDLDLSLYSGDIDLDSLSYTAQSELLDIQISEQFMHITAADNWFGSDIVSVTVYENTQRINAVDSLLVNVTPVNDPPELVLPDSISFNEDEQYILHLNDFALDIDGGELELVSCRTDLIIEQQQMDIIISAPQDWFGCDELEICISDGEQETCDNMQVIVSPVNDAPVIAELPGFSFLEDESISINLAEYCLDIDSSELSLQASADSLILSWDLLLLSISAPQNWYGEDTVSIIITDNLDGYAETQLYISVTPVNDPPSIELLPSYSFIEDSQLMINLADYTFDIDNNELFYNVSSETVICMLEDSWLTISAPPDWFGSEVIAVEVYDGVSRLSASDLAAIIVEPVNDPPVINLPDEISFPEDTQLIADFAEYCSDIDSELLTLTVSGQQENVFAAIDGFLVTFTAAQNWSGSEPMQFDLYDGEYHVNDDINIVVSLNIDEPQFDLPQEFVLMEDTSDWFDLNQYIDNPEQLYLQLIVPEAEHLEFVISSLSLEVIPEADWFGTEAVELAVYNQDNDIIVYAATQFTVNPVNDPPEMDLPASISFDEDSEYDINLLDYTFDIDNEQLVFYADSDSLLCQVNDAVLHITAAENWFGSATIAVTADDQTQRLSVSDQMEVNVIPVNDAPWLNLPSSLQINQGETIELDVSLYGGDIDSDSLLITIESQNIDYEVSGMTILFTAQSSWLGTEEVTVTISDNQFQASDTISIEVISEMVSVAYDLVENWNWISFNSLPEDNSVESVLAELDGYADQIKAQNISTSWFDNWGWVGQLSHLQPGKMYLLHMTAPYEGYTVTGYPADPSSAIPLNIDWNWIGHLPQQPAPVDALLEPLEPNALQLKGQNISTSWFNNWGWVGQLHNTEPGKGYKLNMTAADTLYFPQRALRNSQENIITNSRIWNTTQGYENNMTLISYLNPETQQSYNITEIACLDNYGECRGTGFNIPDSQLWYFTIAGNEDGEVLHFCALTAFGEILELDNTICFINNAALGSPDEPLDLLTAADNPDDIIMHTSLGQSYPNPSFVPGSRTAVYIPFVLAEDTQIELAVYNLKGQCVKRLVSDYYTVGSYQIAWDGKNEQGRMAANGVYLYKLKTHQSQLSKKMIILR